MVEQFVPSVGPVLPSGSGGIGTWRSSPDYLVDVLFPMFVPVGGQALVSFDPSKKIRKILYAYDIAIENVALVPVNRLLVRLEFDGVIIVPPFILDRYSDSTKPAEPFDVMNVEMPPREFTIPGDDLPHTLSLNIIAVADATTNFFFGIWPRIYIYE